STARKQTNILNWSEEVEKDLGNYVSKNNTNQNILIQNQKEEEHAFNSNINMKEGEY
ncbi:9289_t:CDS:1, partial [Acaulospora colombiana]